MMHYYMDEVFTTFNEIKNGIETFFTLFFDFCLEQRILL